MAISKKEANMIKKPLIRLMACGECSICMHNNLSSNVPEGYCTQKDDCPAYQDYSEIRKIIDKNYKE